MKRAYSYLRFSHERQRFGDSIRRQTERFNAFCKRHNLTPDHSLTLSDEGRSAFKGEHLRVGKLGAFLNAAEAGQITSGSCLVIEDFDRLTRLPLKQATQLIMRLLTAEIVIAVMRTDRFYDNSALNDLGQFVEIVIEIARTSQESARKSDLLGAVWSLKKKEAKPGRPITKACPRWLTVKNGKFKPIKSRVAAIKKIFAKLQDGYSIQSIAQQLNRERVATFGRAKAWSYAEVWYLLHNRALIGEYQPMTFRHTDKKPRTDGDKRERFYPPVISPGLFYEAQDILAKRKPANMGRKSYKGVVNLFSGLLFDAIDGSPLYLTGKGNGYNYLVSSAAMNGLSKNYVSFPYHAFENAFRWTWCESLEFEKLLPPQNKEARVELQQVERELRAVTAREAELADLMVSAKELAPVVAAARQVKSERERLTKKLDGLKATVGDNPQERSEAIRTWFNKLIRMTRQDEINDARMRMKALIADAIERIDVSLLAISRNQRQADLAIKFRGRPGSYRANINIDGKELQCVDPQTMNVWESVGGKAIHSPSKRIDLDPLPMDKDPFFHGIVSDLKAKKKTRNRN